ncbi:MAG: hypothetical protein JXR76_32655 [Deltaproteobacteria bacterium]|nr:hypothetical protein [Deltaproteobacteria bacterium]
MAVAFGVATCSDTEGTHGVLTDFSPDILSGDYTGEIVVDAAYNPVISREMGCGWSETSADYAYDVYATPSGKPESWFLLCKGELQLSGESVECDALWPQATSHLVPDTSYNVEVRDKHGSSYFLTRAFTWQGALSDTDSGSDIGSDSGSSTATDTDTFTDTNSSADTGTGVDSAPVTDTATDSATDSATDTNTDSSSDTTQGPYRLIAEYTTDTPDFSGVPEKMWTMTETLDHESGCAVDQIPDNIVFDVLWNEGGLYVAVVVPDDVQTFVSAPNEDIRDYDAVTVFIDVRPLSTPYNQGDNWFAFGCMGTLNDMYTDVPITWASAPTATQYSMEIGIPWSSLGVDTPESGLEFGFDILVHDNDNLGNDCFAFWNSNSEGIDITSNFGRLMLQ